ncbi:MAG TPA: stage II sporulation protein D [Firmicutes bacterium]|uniref:Stage II sporulation protein D n=1 Tax=Capillibacterium thermochitinicola TaxID=2699427 RepID=A0A8J6HZW1_9FIRM|nr:stage II sporulation protein D [Capillibacterium thermochitinicola]MBA2133005.1 stage II sporulation protein D [Capillibacterium thermochitinicola]HHW13022.1 stage II sporulation protein D [Bacillota bacterium]
MRQLIGLFLFIFVLLCLLPLFLVKCTPAPPGITVQLYLNEEKKIIALDLEEYVKGVVAAEMPAEFDLEALKAQAVAARTVAVRRMRRFGGTGYPAAPGADLSDDVRDSQAWLGRRQLIAKWGLWNYPRYWRKISAAVEGTSGLILTYEGRPIDALYHSTSGPRTANAEELWGKPVPYLKSVPCSFGQHSPRYRQERVFTVQELLSALGLAEERAAGGLALRILKRTPSGRVDTMQIGTHVFSGTELRSRLGLASTNFTVHSREGKVVFTTVGYGHGVGLCQYGADGMAKAGKTFQEILQYYYQGVELKKLRLN